jgi:uncharacterized protein YwbE
MLHSIHHRYGEKLRALDGEIGHVRDFYFDDQNWAVRYLVADTGRWLIGRLVLLSPHALGQLVPNEKGLLVNLTRQQIEDSPSIEEHKPVYRQHEEEYHRHYGFPYYAQRSPLWGLSGYPVLVPPPRPADVERKRIDSHLRSTRHVKGYKVEANDGALGEVEDFLIDGKSWMIRKIIIESGHWYSSEKLTIPAEKVSRISYDDSTVYLEAARSEIIKAAEQATASASRLPATAPSSIRAYEPDL